MAIDLCLAAQRSGSMQTCLVLRRKRNTEDARVQALVAQGLDVRVVPGWSHLATIWALYKLARTYRPGILVAHGFSEHLWGRYAGLLAKVPHLVHVEHNSRERYSRWRLWQALWLTRHTAAIVGVSEGVRFALVERGFPAERCLSIPNGIALERFQAADLLPWTQRTAGVLMASRFARQKDQGTLVKALQLLRHRGRQAPLALAGSGKARLIRKTQRQVQAAGLEHQVQFLGQVQDLPKTLMQHQIFVLSTHYEGMPLALIEAMACACACIGSDVVGVREVIEHGRNGLLVPEGDAQALADAIEQLLANPAWAEQLGQAARQQVQEKFGSALMHARYTALMQSLSAQPGDRATIEGHHSI